MKSCVHNIPTDVRSHHWTDLMYRSWELLPFHHCFGWVTWHPRSATVGGILYALAESEEEYYLKCSEGRVAGHSCPWGTRHVGPFSKRLYWWLLEEATHWINKSKKIALKLFIAWPQSHWYLRYFCEFCLCSSLNWSCFCCGCLSCSRQWCPEYIPHH